MNEEYTKEEEMFWKGDKNGRKMKKEELKEDLDKIINRELELWQEAFPQQKVLLKNFSNKIKLELELRLNI